MSAKRGASVEASVDAEFRQFVAARSTSLLRTAYLLVGDWSHAEDVLQTALTKTYLAWLRLGEIETVEAYARRVLVTTATSWWRRRWHGERPTAVMPDRAAPDRIDEQVERHALWCHVRALPTRQRAVLVLRFYEDLTEAETARILGVAVGTVKSQTARALTALRARLGNDRPSPVSFSAPIGAQASAQRPRPNPRSRTQPSVAQPEPGQPVADSSELLAGKT